MVSVGSFRAIVFCLWARMPSGSAANSFRAQSASCEADAMVAICQSMVHPSPPNDVSRTNGRWRTIGSTESVVIGSLLVG